MTKDKKVDKDKFTWKKGDIVVTKKGKKKKIRTNNGKSK